MTHKIISVATTVPKYEYKLDDIITHIKQWTKGLPKSYQEKIIRIFKGAQINQKFGILPIDKVFSPLSFEEKNNIYIQNAVELGSKVLQKALVKSNLTPNKIDCVITTSCTGYMIPSLDAYLINNIGLRHDIERLPVTEIGCAGGTAGLIYANNFLKGNPGKNVALISVEIPSITFQFNDFSLDNIVGSAIFADGAACTILGPTSRLSPTIIDTQMYHLYDTTDILGFDLTNSGFKVVLSEKIPNQITEHFENIVIPFLKRNKLTIKDISSFIFHPGGKKITNKIESFLSLQGKNMDQSREIMKQYGNMSSATVLFILEEFLEKPIDKDSFGLMLSFGPGFTAQSILLKWT